MTKRWVMAGLLVLGATYDVGAESNLGAGGYPSHHCGEKPSQPTRPEYFKSEAELAAYNQSVETFNTTTGQYFVCIQQYVNNAAKDIELIRSTLATTIEEAND